MMGVGKTTLGKQFAKQLHYSYLDLDKEIEKSEGKSIPEIFEQKGEAYFRQLEQRALHATAARNHLVIATGGGTPCYYNNMEWMNEQGKTIYLKANAAFILSRISAFPDKRPLLKGKSPDELAVFIAELLENRSPYYNKAQLIVEMPVKSVSDIVKSIV